jgi:hypothetical protein
MVKKKEKKAKWKDFATAQRNWKPLCVGEYQGVGCDNCLVCPFNKNCSSVSKVRARKRIEMQVAIQRIRDRYARSIKRIKIK